MPPPGRSAVVAAAGAVPTFATHDDLESLWPRLPGTIPRYRRWLDQAREVLEITTTAFEVGAGTVLYLEGLCQQDVEPGRARRRVDQPGGPLVGVPPADDHQADNRGQNYPEDETIILEEGKDTGDLLG